MIAWQTVAILAGFFIALGVAFDRLLATRWKRKLHYRLVHWWNELDETRIPDLFARAAGWIISRFDHFSPKKRYWLLAYSAGTLVCLTIGSTGPLIDSSKSSPELPALTDVHPDFSTVCPSHTFLSWSRFFRLISQSCYSQSKSSGAFAFIQRFKTRD